MNPLAILWLIRIGIAVAALASLTAVYMGWAHHEQKIGSDAKQAEWDADNAKKVLALAASNEEIRRMDQRRQSTVTEASNAAQKQNQLARRDAADARAAVDGVRSDLAAARTQLAGATEAARAKYAAAVDTVFADCTRRYSEMAEAAQGHSIDSLMYQTGWPK